MRTATKRLIAGATLLAGLVTLVAGVTQGVPFSTVLMRTIIAAAAFGTLSFLGGLVYEKLWLR
ncbi:MAG: hypothetical protein P9L99_01200 [Candidatus Lernaella stagnicola]|nr:hypothetical protein [Candidatus Lernaella stagnicola]